MTDYTPQLPDIFPVEEIRVEDESHRYRTYEGDSSNPVLEEREYTLDKAPVGSVISISGVSSAQTIEFTEGIDYELSSDNEKIIWQDDPADRPDAGSNFYVTYRCDSILSRYIDSADDELHTIDEKVQDAISSKFVDSAEGKELDELGKLFGVLGKRSGRDDEQYRIYLKSVVQSFISRGTIRGIKLAISAATEVPIEDIAINEDFVNNEYEIVVIPDNPITGSLIEQVAQIADPSGVEQDITRFRPEPDEIGIGDEGGYTVSTKYPDDMGIEDTVAFSLNNVTEIAGLDDTVAIDPNKFTSSDTAVFDDTATSNRLGSGDSLFADDVVATSSELVMFWDTHNWDGKNWA